MNSDRNGRAEFWLDLLMLGDGEQQRRQIWNDYCNSICAEFIELLPPDERERIDRELDFPKQSSGINPSNSTISLPRSTAVIPDR